MMSKYYGNWIIHFFKKCKNSTDIFNDNVESDKNNSDDEVLNWVFVQ